MAADHADRRSIDAIRRTPRSRDAVGQTFAWATGEATLTLDTGGNAVLLVRERGGKEVAVRLKRE